MKHFKKLGLSGRTVLHGFRASFKSWASACTDIPREVIEMSLSHKVGDAVEQAYQRSGLAGKEEKAHAAVGRFLGWDFNQVGN